MIPFNLHSLKNCGDSAQFGLGWLGFGWGSTALKVKFR